LFYLIYSIWFTFSFSFWLSLACSGEQPVA